MSKPKLLWVSDNPYLNFVGQSIVGRQVLTRLTDKYEIYVHGFTEVKHAQHHIGHQLPFPVITAERLDDDALKKTCEQIKPDVLVFSHDTFLFGGIEEIRKSFPAMKIVGWLTIDGEPLPMAYRQVLSNMDSIVTPTHWGKEVIANQFFDLPVHVVPYGVDHNIWKPRDDRRAIIEELRSIRLYFAPYLTEKISKPETFVGIFWGHNQGKKNIGNIIHSWIDADLPADQSHLILVLHSRKQNFGKLSYLADFDYRQIAMEHQDRLSVLEGSYVDETMVKLVQLANTVVFPSIGEGFGMPLIEGMATGLVPITTNYAGVTDFCIMDHNALMVGGELIYGDMGVRRIAASQKHLTKTIQSAFALHQEPDRRMPLVVDNKPSEYPSWNDLRQNAIAQASKYTWDESANGLHTILQHVLKPDFQAAYVHSSI